MTTSTARKHASTDEADDADDVDDMDISKWKVVGRGIYAPPRPRFSLDLLRKSLDLTQEEVAERAGMTQSEVSRLEKREDCRVSTMDRYAKALGGKLRLSLSINGGDYELEEPEDEA